MTTTITAQAPETATRTLTPIEAEVLDCPACDGHGEIAVGQRDRETGAYDTQTCWACDGGCEIDRTKILLAATRVCDGAWEAGSYWISNGYRSGQELDLICEWTYTTPDVARLLLALHAPEFLAAITSEAKPAEAPAVSDPWVVPSVSATLTIDVWREIIGDQPPF